MTILGFLQNAFFLLGMKVTDINLTTGYENIVEQCLAIRCRNGREGEKIIVGKSGGGLTFRLRVKRLFLRNDIPETSEYFEMFQCFSPEC